MTSPDTSALSLTRTSGFGEFYDVCGHKSLLMGAEGKDFEVWIYPFKAFRDCKVGVVQAGKVLWLWPFLTNVEVAPHATTFTYEAPGARVKQTIFAPIDQPAIVMLFDLVPCSDTQVVVQLLPDMQLMWPADPLKLDPAANQQADSGRWVLKSMNRQVAAVAGWTEPGLLPSGVDADCPTGAILSVGQAREGHACFIVTGDKHGEAPALAVWDGIASAPKDHLREAMAYYAALDAGTTGFECPDADLVEAFRWAKIGLDKCYKVSPDVGAGFVAGYGPSGEGARPGFGWYFGRDSSWSQFAFNCIGGFAKSRDNLELLGRFQIRDGQNRGKIYHELSAAHDYLPPESVGYAYVAGDATPFYVADMADYLRWTGDLDFVKSKWESIVDAIDWCYRMDVDGDGLIDNPPAGHQWYDYGEKNMVDLVAIWLRALEGAAELGRAIGDQRASKWSRDAERVRQILNTDFWDDSRGYLHDRKLPDGAMSDLTTANPTIPLLWKQIEPDRAGRAIDRMLLPDMTVGWGLRTNSNLDSIHVANGYHEGTVWPLVTGWGSLACFAYGRSVEGMRYLAANVDLTRDFCLGYIAEVLDGDSRVPGGCPHQCWSEAMIVLPVVAGLMGVEADALGKRIGLNPQVPKQWEWARLSNLRIADDVFDIGFQREKGKAVLTIDHKQGRGHYTAVVPGGREVAVEGSARVEINE